MSRALAGRDPMDDDLWLPMKHRLRWAVSVFAAISAAAHLPVLAEHLRAAPYLGVEFVVLIVGCASISVAVLICDSAALYSAAALACLLAITGYLATRMVAFPELSDDVGNWFEPMGVVSVSAEAVTASAALWALGVRRAHHGAESWFHNSRNSEFSCSTVTFATLQPLHYPRVNRINPY